MHPTRKRPGSLHPTVIAAPVLRRSQDDGLLPQEIPGCLTYLDGRNLARGDYAGRGGEASPPATGVAMVFDGLTDKITCGNDTSLQITDTMTVSAWFKTDDATANKAIISKYLATGDARSWALNVESGQIRFYTSATGAAVVIGLTTETHYDNDLWYYVVAVYEPSTSIKIYVDGKLVVNRTTSIPASLYNTSHPVEIGTFNNTGYRFDGEIADVAIYAGAASLADVEYAFKHRVLPGMRPGSAIAGATDLRGHWPLSEGYYATDQTAAFDFSSHGNHGTITTAPSVVTGQETIPQLSERGFTRAWNADETNDSFVTLSNLFTGNLDQDFTISLMFSRPSYSGADFIWFWQVDANNRIFLRSRATDGRISVVVEIATVEESLGLTPDNGSVYDPPLNTPIHYTVVHTAATNKITLYVNGAFQWDEVYTSTLPTTGADTFAIINATAAGIWDECAIFDHAFGAAAIVNLYNGGNPLDARFDEPTSGGAYAFGTLLEHYWRNGYDTGDGTVVEDLKGAADLTVGGTPERIFLQVNPLSGRTVMGGFPRQAGDALHFPEAGAVRALGKHIALNPDLDNNAEDWTVGCSGTAGDGYVTCTNQAFGCALITQNTETMPTGDSILVRVVVDEFAATGGDIQIGLGSQLGATSITAPGVYEETITLTGDATNASVLLGNPVALSARVSHFSARKVILPDIFAGGGTFSCWIKAMSSGAASAGRIFDKVNSFIYVFNAGQLTLVSVRATTNGSWATTANDVLFGEWTHIAITYDDSDVANNPIFYVNGVEKTVGSGLTETSTPIGAATSDASDVATIGNFITDIRAFDGDISDVAFHDGILTAAEAVALYQGSRHRFGV